MGIVPVPWPRFEGLLSIFDVTEVEVVSVLWPRFDGLLSRQALLLIRARGQSDGRY